MRAAFVTEVEKVEVKEIDRPVISDTEVLIKARGRLRFRPPPVPGNASVSPRAGHFRP
mgnify:CR=1 FL=1